MRSRFGYTALCEIHTALKKKIRKLRYIFNTYNRKFLRYELEYKILLGSGVLIVAFLILAYVKYPHLLFNELETSTDVLTTNAQILATIFAITISLTLLGLQYLSQSLTPRILGSFIRSKFIAGLLISYIFSIAVNIFVLSFPKVIEPTKFIYWSYLLLIWCVLYLTSYLFYMIRKIQPTGVLDEIEKQIPLDYDRVIIYKFNQRLIDVPDEQDKFIDLEQILIKTIRNNDFFSYIDYLKLLFKKQITFLENIYKKGPNDEQGYNQMHHDAEAISLYFLRIHKQIYFEILREKNERFLLHYVNGLSEIIKILLKLKAIRPLREINDHFNDVGLQIIDKKLHSTFGFYCQLLDDVAKEEFQNVPSGNLFLEFQDKMVPLNSLPKKEQDERVLGHIIYDYFSYNRLKFFEELSMKASDRGYEDIVVSVKHSLSELLDMAIKKDDNKKMRFWLVSGILNSLKKIHDYSLTKNIDVPFFGLLQLHYKIESIKDEETINSLGILITKYYCDGAINTTKRDYYSAVFHLGIDGRSLVSEYPQITEIIVDSLIECLKIVTKDKKFRNINTDMVAKELNSIQVWNKHKHKKIEDKIDEAFKKYKVKIKNKK